MLVKTFDSGHIVPNARIKRGERGSGIPPEKSQPSHTGPDPLKFTRLPSQQLMWAIIGPPAKRHFNGVSLAGRLLPAFGGFWSLAPLKKAYQSWTHFDKTLWIRACTSMIASYFWVSSSWFSYDNGPMNYFFVSRYQ